MEALSVEHVLPAMVEADEVEDEEVVILAPIQVAVEVCVAMVLYRLARSVIQDHRPDRMAMDTMAVVLARWAESRLLALIRGLCSYILRSQGLSHEADRASRAGRRVLPVADGPI